MTIYNTLKGSLRPARRVWAAIENVRTAQSAGDDVEPHLDALSGLYQAFLTRRIGPVMDEAARVLEEVGTFSFSIECRPLSPHEIAR